MTPHLAAVSTEGTAAAQAPAQAPPKPRPVAEDRELSELWDALVDSLDAVGMVSPVDGFALEMAIRHFRAARRASDELASGPVTLTDHRNKREMKAPAEVVFRSESDMFLKYAQQLAITFVSRARTATKSTPDDQANPFAPTGS